MHDGVLTLTECFVFYTIFYGLQSIHVLIVGLTFFQEPVEAPAKMHRLLHHQLQLLTSPTSPWPLWTLQNITGAS